MSDMSGKNQRRKGGGAPNADPADGAAVDAASPFARFAPAGELPGRAGRTFTERAGDEERAAIAAAFDLRALDELSLEGRFERAAADMWRFSGRVRAKATQSCVVTLDPVAAPVDEPFERLYDPGAAPVDPLLEVDLEHDDEDPPEALGAGVDIGAVALECLALALDPYPRSKGAVFDGRAATPPGAEPITDEALKPFAGLAALRKSLEEPD